MKHLVFVIILSRAELPSRISRD